MAIPVAIPPFPLAGEVASLTAALIWACSMTTFRRYGAGIPAVKLNLFKNVIALACLLVTIIVCRAPFPENGMSAINIAASGLIGLAIGDTFLFAALKRLGAQLTSASQCLSPMFTALIAWLILGEKLTGLEIAGMTVTTLAVAGSVVFHLQSPSGDTSAKGQRTGLIFAVLSALANGVGIVVARHSFADVHVATGTALRILPAIAVLWVFSLVRRRKESPAGKGSIKTHLWPLSLAAFAGTFVGVMLLSYGTKYAKAGITASLTITYPLWIIPIAYFFLGERVRPGAAICTLVAIAGVLLLMLGK